MTKKQVKKQTERALYLSVISTVLCIFMLIGMTFAWFTSTVESDNNVITTAAFEVDVYWSEDCNAPATSAEAEASPVWFNLNGTKPFNETAYLPGEETVRYIAMYNKSGFNVKFDISLRAIVPDTNNDTADLLNALEIYTKEPVTSAVTTSGMTKKGTAAALQNADTAALTQISSSVVNAPVSPATESVSVTAVAVKLPESYSHATSQTVNFIIKVIASQWNTEHEEATATFSTTDQTVISTPQATVYVPTTATTEGGTALQATDTLTLSVMPGDADPSLTVTTGTGTTTYEVSLTNQDNVKVISDTGIKVELDIGVVDLQAFYHNTTALTLTNDTDNDGILEAADVTVLNTYFYDINTGIITFITDSFSPFTAAYEFAGGLGTEQYPYLLETADQWDGLYKKFLTDPASNLYFALNNDIDFTGKTIDNYASDTVYNYTMENLVLDGNNHTLIGINNYTGYKQLFPYINNSTIKNITINYNINSTKTIATSYNANNVTFENVTVTGVLKTTADWSTAFVAYPFGSGSVVYRNCTNYAKLQTNLTTNSYVAPFGSHTMSIGSLILDNCANYGEIIGGHASAFIGMTGGNVARYTVNNLTNYGAVRYTVGGNLFSYDNHALNAQVTAGEGSSVTELIVPEINLAIEDGKLVIKDADENIDYEVTMSVSIQMYNYNNSGTWSGGFPRTLSKTYSGVNGDLVTDFVSNVPVMESPCERTGYGQDGAVAYHGIFVPDNFDLNNATVLLEDSNSVIKLVTYQGQTFYYMYDSEWPAWYSLVTSSNGAETGELKGNITVTFNVQGDLSASSISYTFSIADAAAIFAN